MNKDKTKKINKEQKGVTLIALVITIIVLLILAGVAISTLTGENGIISRAKTAKSESEYKKAEEEAILIYDEYQMYKKVKGTKGETTNIEDFLNERYPGNTKNEDGTFTIVTDSGNKVKLDDNGNLIVNDKIISGKKTESITINGDTSVNIGTSITLNATMNAEDVKYKSIEWSSSDDTKVTVNGNDKTCIVTGKSMGNTTITCKVINYDGTIINNTFKISVYNYLSSQLGGTASGRGKVVQYSAGGVSEWKVFYIDTDTVFLITTKSISPNWPSKESTNAATTTSWASYLTSNSNWSGFVDEQVAESATGSPTLNQINTSYGSSYPIEKEIVDVVLNNGTWWNLASPCGADALWALYGGTLTAGAWRDNILKCRPVVKLKPGIKISGGNGTESNPYILVPQ